MQMQTAAAVKPVASKTATATKAAATPIANAQLANVQRQAEAGATVKLKSLLAEFKLPSDGKLARRFLRKANFGWHSNAERWEFTESQATDVRAVLAKLPKK